MPRRITPFLGAGPTEGQLDYIPSNGLPVPLTLENAVCTLNDLVPFLYPHAPSDRSSLPVYGFEQTTIYPCSTYVAHLRLAPIDPHLPVGHNEFWSAPMSNKKDAKKHAALAACRTLYRRNLPSQGIVLGVRASLDAEQVSRQTYSSLLPPRMSMNREAQPPTLIQLNPLARPRLPPLAAISTPSPQPSTEGPANAGVQSPIPQPVTPASATLNSDGPDLVLVAHPNPLGQAHCAGQLFLNPLTFHLPPPDAQTYSLGVVSGRPLEVEAGTNEREIDGHVLTFTLGAPVALHWTAAQRATFKISLQAFTRLAIETAVCGTRYPGDFGYFLAPLTPAGDIDFVLLCQPTSPVRGLYDLAAGDLLVSELAKLRYRLFRSNATSANLGLTSTHSRIPPDSCLAKNFAKHLPNYSSVAHFYTEFFAIPTELQTGPLVQLDSALSFVDEAVMLVCPEGGEQALLPLGVLKRTRLPLSFWRTAAYLPFLVRAIADASHAQTVCVQVESRTLSRARVIEALTPPGRGVGMDNAMLGAVGESFLKLASTVHIYLSNPCFDHGALSGLRSRQTDNAFLRAKLVDSGLAKHILLSRFRTADKFVAVDEQEHGKLSEDGESLTGLVEGKILSDVAEALLGAAYVSGGIGEGLLVGTHMGLILGGSTPWETRPGVATSGAIGEAAGGATGNAALDQLEDRLGYAFAERRLLVRALTHQSAAKTGDDHYQRLQWLGDAVLDLWAVQMLFHNLSPVTSMQLRLIRASLVSKGTLGFLGLRKLMLADLLEEKVDGVADQLKNAREEYSRFEPIGVFFKDLANAFVIPEAPRILSEVVVALIGAVFADCGFRLEKAFGVLERVYEDLVGQQEDLRLPEPSHLLRTLTRCNQTTLKTRVQADTESDTGSSDDD